MSLPHIMLGLIATPMSGYEIKKEFDGSLRHFWFAELSQVYPVLKKLVRDGLASVEAVESKKGPAKKLYCRTEAGRDSLVDWIAGSAASAPNRNPFLGQVFFLSELKNPQQAYDFFTSLKRRFTGAYDALVAVEEEWKAENPAYPDALTGAEFYQQMTLDVGLQVQKTYMDWCERCLEKIGLTLMAGFDAG